MTAQVVRFADPMTEVRKGARGPIGFFLHDLPHRLVNLFYRPRSVKRLVTIALTAFFSLAVLAVYAEPFLLSLDTRVEATVIGARTQWWNQAMVLITFLGTRYAIAGLGLAFSLWVWKSGRCRKTMWVLMIAIALNPVFEIFFKQLVGRVRPQAAQLLPGNGPSFPSGHVLAAVGFYGLLALIAWRGVPHYWWRRLAFFGLGAIALVVSASRIYLDVHWTTDVLAGMLLGITLVAASYQFLRQHSLQPAHACCRDE